MFRNFVHYFQMDTDKSNIFPEPSKFKDEYQTGVFYPTGVREGISCDLLAITILDLVVFAF